MPRELTEEEVRTFRDRLCATFTRLFTERGYQAVTMRALADELGCSPMTPYRYFKDKEEILAATRAAGFRKLSDELMEACAAEPSPIDRARRACETFLSFARREPDTYRIMYTTLQPDLQQFPELAGQIERARGLLADLAESVPQVRASGFKPSTVAQVFWAALHGVISIQLADGYDDETSFEEIVAVLMSILVEGGKALFHLENNAD